MGGRLTVLTVAGDPAKTRNLASIYVRLRPIETRKRDQLTIMEIVRNDIVKPLAADLRTSVQQIANIGGGGAQNAAVQFVVNGPDLKKLDQISRQLVERVKAIPGVVDLDTSFNSGKPELSVRTSAFKWPMPQRRCASLSAAIKSRPTTKAANNTRCTCAPGPRTAAPRLQSPH